MIFWSFNVLQIPYVFNDIMWSLMRCFKNCNQMINVFKIITLCLALYTCEHVAVITVRGVWAHCREWEGGGGFCSNIISNYKFSERERNERSNKLKLFRCQHFTWCLSEYRSWRKKKTPPQGRRGGGGGTGTQHPSHPAHYAYDHNYK